MAYEKNRRRPPQEDDGTLIEGRNAVLETLRSGRAVDKIFLAEGAHLDQRAVIILRRAAAILFICHIFIHSMFDADILR